MAICRASSSSTTSLAESDIGGSGDSSSSVAETSSGVSSSTVKPNTNPFLPLLSKGLYRTSIAMHKATSDKVFKSTPSLQRMRKQVQQLTNIAPSSLGDHAGLGLFATKNIKAGTVVGLYPAHALGYELVMPMPDDSKGELDEENLQDLSMFLAENEEDEKYFSENPHGNSPYLHATDQPLFQRPSLLSSLFDEGKNEMAPPLYLDVNPNRNGELDGTWTSHYINDGASLLDLTTSGNSVENGIEQYYIQSTRAKNCIHIPFGPSPILATVTTKKVKKGQELFTSYGVVYWLGAVDTLPEDEESTPGMTEKIQEQIVESARDLQKAMEDTRTSYATEMEDLENVIGEL
eukprot:CAMPEP_0183729586 /NCGR_PEP_ID=MMETSP0737-20130205/30680_1 /TAXON_ID=385413 /ORGANISM="Thalassiosira miniscula, Strain CCMP1093" /LENGTH=347 /DNA_ID=CAMNT_0025961817 /DNA_START=123 /DNA_END=1166 /DNA_ORIENTATION=-